MAESSKNLLVRLHKWAARQDENFITECFAHLVQHLIDNEPEAACNLLSRLTDGVIRAKPSDLRFVEVNTQITTREGKPDLEISIPNVIALIEIKSESEPNPDQLRRYRAHLAKSGAATTRLILLTRYPADIAEPDCKPDLYLRWYQVAEWIGQEQHHYSFKAVSNYLVDQLIGFFGYRNMTMGQVTWELASGVRSLRMLTDMLFEAANACKLKAQIWGNSQKMGVRLSDRRYWFGIWLDRPEILVLSTDCAKIDKDRAALAAQGEDFVWQSGDYFGVHISIDLNSEEVHFFARSKASQLQFLEDFLKDGLARIQPLEVASTGSSVSENDLEPNIDS